MLEQARRSPQTVDADWTPVAPLAVHDVRIKELRNVVIRSGVLTECFRPEWFDHQFMPAHAVHMSLLPGGTSAWHFHKNQNDVIIPVRGQLRIGIYDGRPDSPTYQKGQVLHVSVARPVAIFIPPCVWHAIRNPGADDAAYVVLNDVTFHYEEPDDWTVPHGAEHIPLRLD